MLRDKVNFKVKKLLVFGRKFTPYCKVDKNQGIIRFDNENLEIVNYICGTFNLKKFSGNASIKLRLQLKNKKVKKSEQLKDR